MKLLFTALSVTATFFIWSTSFSQNTDDPGAYMNAIGNAQTEMNQKYMAYMSAAAHGRRAKKVEKLRHQVLESIDNSRFKTLDLPKYKGDNTLRQSSVDYIKLCFNVFNEDYSKIVNMEDIAEQSYDMMQAYILLNEKTSEKINDAVSKMRDANNVFAAKYNVKIIEQKDELGSKLDDAGKLNHYTDKIYLVFFKCYWQDGEIVKAMNNGKITEMEQGRSSLIRFADEGLATLDTIKPFAGDASFVNSCKQILRFYKDMAEKDLPKQVDYFLKKENFEKIKKSLDGKSKSDRTKEDVNAYNKAVDDFNKATSSFNSVNKSMNDSRNYQLDNYNEAEKKFNDAHMPYYK